MKAGTLITLPDGRQGRVVYNGLDGVGIKWGTGPVAIDVVMSSNPVFGETVTDPELLKWAPDAMLRDPYPGCDPALEYVGTEYTRGDEPQDHIV